VLYEIATDDEIGFDISKRKRGVGISNIFSRAVLYKGNVIITSIPGNGCRVGIIFNEVDLLSDQIFTEG